MSEYYCPNCKFDHEPMMKCVGPLPQPSDDIVKWLRGQDEEGHHEAAKEIERLRGLLEQSKDKNNMKQLTFEQEDHNGFRRQITPPGAEWYPPIPEMDLEEATRRLNEGSLWIRSTNVEYYYSYAVVEDCEGGQRYFVKGTYHADGWEDVTEAIEKWS